MLLVKLWKNGPQDQQEEVVFMQKHMLAHKKEKIGHSFNAKQGLVKVNSVFF